MVNDISVKKYSHNICDLFKCHKTYCSDLSIETFTKPPLLSDDLWRQGTVEHFISQINVQGQPDSRYGLVSWSNRPDDLFKLDQVVFAIKRLSIGLDWIVGADWDVNADERDKDITRHKGKRFRDVLKQLPEYQVLGMLDFPDIPTDIAGKSLSDIMYAWNFSFPRDEEDLKKPGPKTIAPLFGAFENSYLYILNESLTEENCKNDPFLVDGVKWLLNHVKINRSAEKEFKQRLSKFGY